MRKLIPTMAGAGKEASHLETAHVLFIDVVAYSKLLVNEQREVLQQLNDVVRSFSESRRTCALRDGNCQSAQELSTHSPSHGRS